MTTEDKTEKDDQPKADMTEEKPGCCGMTVDEVRYWLEFADAAGLVISVCKQCREKASPEDGWEVLKQMIDEGKILNERPM